MKMALIDSVIMRQIVTREIGDSTREWGHNSLTIHENGKTTYGQLLK